MTSAAWKKRLAAWAYLVLILTGISLAVFGLFALAPGDPAEIILRGLSDSPGPEQISALRQELGLDRPWPLRYLFWAKQVICLDLGTSWTTGMPVAREISGRMGPTIELAAAAFCLTLVIGCLFGTACALLRNRLPDLFLQVLSAVVTAMPGFWVGTLMIYLFSLRFPILPVAGQGSAAHLVMPALTLALGVAFVQGSFLRSLLIQILSQDHIRFARARGLSGWRIVYRHILPGVLGPMATLWGISLGQLLGGAVIVETVFAWPGIGRFLAESVMARDIPCIQALVLLIALVFVLVNRLADQIHHRLDPRLGYR